MNFLTTKLPLPIIVYEWRCPCVCRSVFHSVSVICVTIHIKLLGTFSFCVSSSQSNYFKIYIHNNTIILHSEITIGVLYEFQGEGKHEGSGDGSRVHCYSAVVECSGKVQY